MRLTTMFVVPALLMAAVWLTPPMPAAAAAPAAMETAEDPFSELHREFKRLYRALANKGGIEAHDEPYLEDMQERLGQFTARHPDHRVAIACELQISIWLEDDDRVDALFERLIGISENKSELGLAWAEYFEERGQDERVDAIYDMLLDLDPDDVSIRLRLAKAAMERNAYPRVLELLEAADLDPMDQPEAVITKGKALYAENRFEEALEVFRSVPEEATEILRRLRTEQEQYIEWTERYVVYWEQEQEWRAEEASADDLPRVELTIADRGRIVVELYENHAPNTVANFITLVEDGFYDETRFHRVITNFMAQGGCPNTRPDADGVPGQGGPGYRIPDEHTQDQFRWHFAGSLAMANTGQPNSGGSQFYLTHMPTQHLNGRHTVFGRVLEGLDVVRSIQRDDVLEQAVVLRKRDHDYTVETLPEEEDPAPTVPGRAPGEAPPGLPPEIREQIERGEITLPPELREQLEQGEIELPPQQEQDQQPEGAQP